MTTLKALKTRITAAGALAAVALLVAACGGSSSKTTNNNTTGAAAATSGGGSSYRSASGGSAKAVAVSTATGSGGAHLVASGRAVYLWEADHGHKSSCSGACAQAWPPVTSKAAAKAAGAAKSADLGTITRSDGSKQVTYKGHPLYWYAEDTAAGQTNGQGSNGFGAKWWLVTPAGAAITSTGSSQAAQSSSSGYSSSGY